MHHLRRSIASMRARPLGVLLRIIIPSTKLLFSAARAEKFFSGMGPRLTPRGCLGWRPLLPFLELGQKWLRVLSNTPRMAEAVARLAPRKAEAVARGCGMAKRVMRLTPRMAAAVARLAPRKAEGRAVPTPRLAEGGAAHSTQGGGSCCSHSTHGGG